ncbi:D-Ala-D-Ala carboxypeptidase family metallohydrolase [Nitrosomonas communis]|uniref:Peptidase M15 n=1 Tax=Nitrosomonas communis TaxID=44574 RepID=A0A1H2XDH1_9PROT|nr:Peptidase M15 [Nitrosomonas communis]
MYVITFTPIREHYGIPFVPNSRYRISELNCAIHGTKVSQHTLGQAVDVKVKVVSNYEIAIWISKNLQFDQLILENYTSGIPDSACVHYSYVKKDNRMNLLTIEARKHASDSSNNGSL